MERNHTICDLFMSGFFYFKFLRFIHVVACSSTLLPRSLLWLYGYIQPCMDGPQFVYPFTY